MAPSGGWQGAVLGGGAVIFLTLGTQLPFDRLLKAVDRAAEGLDEAVFAQIGTGGEYTPQHMETVDYLSPTDFNATFAKARVIVGHAGTGTILAGMKAQKPVVVMARRGHLGEHRNDHQHATVAQMGEIPGLYVAEDAEALRDLLERDDLEPMGRTASPARAQLIDRLRAEVFGS